MPVPWDQRGPPTRSPYSAGSGPALLAWADLGEGEAVITAACHRTRRPAGLWRNTESGREEAPSLRSLLLPQEWVSPGLVPCPEAYTLQLATWKIPQRQREGPRA